MKKAYNGVAVPTGGNAIGYSNGELQVPDNPIIPFIEGDGTGRDIWKASRRVFDAAVEKSYGGKRRVVWFEVFAGEKAFNTFKQWLPDDTVEAARDFRVSIKGPLTTPVGGGIRSLNVALRQILDLYACVRPVRYFTGVPSPVREPEKMHVVIFRENTEDVYIGIEWRSGSPEAKKLPDRPQGPHQRAQAGGVLRVEAELHMEDVELPMMVQHPRRRQHDRRPPLAGRHVWSRRHRVIQP
jgi:isocitrate dehydrogenase